MNATVDLDRAREALHALPADLPREEWVRAGMAAKAAGLSFDDFDAWSATGASYRAADVRDTWRSLSVDGGIGAGTLFHMAKGAGWRADGREHPRDGMARQALAQRPERPARRPNAHESPRQHGPRAAAVWARCRPATAEHGYIREKLGRPDGLRVVPEGDALRVAGLPMVGALVVPVLPLTGGDPVSLQFIAPPDLAAQWRQAGKPSKLNLPGAPMAGVFVVGELAAGGTAYVVEGIGQAWACWKATGAAAVVAFGWGRVRTVATELRRRDPAARLVLVPDAGKEADAEVVADAVDAELVTMPDGSPQNFDAADLAQAQGSDTLEALLAQARPPVARRTLRLEDLTIDERRRCVVRNDGAVTHLSEPQFALLQLLASEPGRLFRTDEIAAAVLGAEPAAKNPAGAVRIVVHRVRAALAPLNPIESRLGGYALALRPPNGASDAAATARKPEALAAVHGLGDRRLAHDRQARFTDIGKASQQVGPPVTRAPGWSVVPLDDLDTAEVPAQAWTWEGYIPAGEVTLLGAHGGTGKSMIALMLAVSVALGLPLFGVPTTAAPVVFFSAEDGAETVRRRLQAVLRSMAIPAEAVAARLTVLDATHGAPELAGPIREASHGGRPAFGATLLGDDLRAFVADLPSPLLIVDNASDTMGGEEIDRKEVRTFVRLLAGMVRDTGGAVLLLAHVNRATAKGSRLGGDAEGYSGSTAWHNSARSRLFLERDRDTGCLTLEHQKSNHGPRRETLRLTWPEDGLPALDEPASPMAAAVAAGDATRALLRLVHEFTCRGEFVSTATTSRTHAGKLLRPSPDFPSDLTDGKVFELLRAAERRGWLRRMEYRGTDRKSRERWQVTAEGASAADIRGFAATAATAATTHVAALPAVGAASPTEPAATAATSPHRGVGGKARTPDAAPVAAAASAQGVR